MAITYLDSDGKTGATEVRLFDAPEDCWDDLMKSLSPSRFDPLPSNWRVLGAIDIELKRGGKCQVGLYDLSYRHSSTGPEEVGAFAAGPNFDNCNYYRGGYTSKLKAAVKRAYLEYQKRAKPLKAEGRRDN